MINVELKVVDDPLRQKIEKIQLYRLSILIKNDIDEYFESYFKYSNSGFRFQFIKSGISEILDKHNIEYRIEYVYDKDFDTVKIYMVGNFVLDLNFVRENDFHI